MRKGERSDHSLYSMEKGNHETAAKERLAHESSCLYALLSTEALHEVGAIPRLAAQVPLLSLGFSRSVPAVKFLKENLGPVRWLNS